MRLEHRFTVPVPPDVAWEALLDPERVAPCFPGATLQTVTGSAFTGTVKVRLGPVALQYKGKGVFTGTDNEARRTVIEASGKDTRGNGTAAANVAVTVRPDAEGTAVDLATDLKITGRPAQLGRGLIEDVSGKLVASFAECLAASLVERPADEPGATAGFRTDPTGPASSETPGSGVRVAEPSSEAEINLIQVAGAPVLKRVAPVLLCGLVLLLVVRYLLRRWR